MKQVLVTGSVYPDTDAVSCMLAYASYQQTRDSSKTYVAAAGGGLHVEPRFVCEQLGLEVRILGDNDKFDEFILVDASEQFIAAYDPGASGPMAQRSAIERAIVAFIAPHLLPLEREFIQQNHFRMTYRPFDWRLNDLTGGPPK